jgi:hypothetical protein
MVWVITIATFFGTAVALLLLFLITFQKKQIREALREQRIEKRIPATGDLELFSLEEPLIYDKAVIKNASRHGACVVVKKPWRPNDHLLVRLPKFDSSSPARIAYCNSLPGGVFAIGLQFPSVVGDAVKSKREEFSSHPYRK